MLSLCNVDGCCSLFCKCSSSLYGHVYDSLMIAQGPASKDIISHQDQTSLCWPLVSCTQALMLSGIRVFRVLVLVVDSFFVRLYHGCELSAHSMFGWYIDPQP